MAVVAAPAQGHPCPIGNPIPGAATLRLQPRQHPGRGALHGDHRRRPRGACRGRSTAAATSSRPRLDRRPPSAPARRPRPRPGGGARRAPQPRRLLVVLADRCAVVGRRDHLGAEPRRAGAPRPPMGLIHPLDWQFRDGAYFVGDRAARRVPSSSTCAGPGPIVGGRGSGAFERFAAELGYTLTVKDYAASVFYSGGSRRATSRSTRTASPKSKADELSGKWEAKHGRRATAGPRCSTPRPTSRR